MNCEKLTAVWPSWHHLRYIALHEVENLDSNQFRVKKMFGDLEN